MSFQRLLGDVWVQIPTGATRIKPLYGFYNAYGRFTGTTLLCALLGLRVDKLYPIFIWIKTAKPKF